MIISAASRRRGFDFRLRLDLASALFPQGLGSCAMAGCIEFRDFDVLRLDTFDLDAPGLGIRYPNAETISKLLEDKGTALIKIDATARGGALPVRA